MQNTLSQRVRGWTPFFLLMDCIAISTSFLFAYALSQFFPPSPLDLDLLPPRKDGVLLALSAAALMIQGFLWLRDGHYMQRLLGGQIIKICISQWLVMVVALLVYVALWRDYRVSRKLLLMHLLWVPPALYLGKVIFIRLLKSLGARIRPRLRILVVCDQAAKSTTWEWFADKEMLGIHLCDVLVEESKDNNDRLIELRLEKSIESEKPNMVIWRLPTDAARTERIRTMTESYGAHLAVDLQAILGHRGELQLSEYSTMKLISLHKHPLVCPAQRLLKRVLDVAISLPVVIFILPFLCAAVAVLHRIFSPGPLFFKQTRSGANGETFKIFKFRTMCVNNSTEGTQARPNDSRIFPTGALLRKLSIDEMPQFLNVLMGDMSVVGPRPHMLEHDVLFSIECRQYPLRQSVRPGVTGLAQIRGHRGPIDNASDIEHRVISDIEYCENWSFSLDLNIIAQTFLHVFSFHPKSC